jgi:hypothetical protein
VSRDAHANGNKQGVLEALAGFACLAVETVHFTRAAHVFGAVEALGKGGRATGPADQGEWDCSAAQLHARFTEDEVTAQWSAGRALSLEVVLALAHL